MVAPSLAAAAATLAGRLGQIPAGSGRRLVAVAGPPGAGKSTLAALLVETLNGRGVPSVLMPMDGFHLDNRLLGARGLLGRKGAPESFDFGGVAVALSRARSEASVILPVFDRARDIAIAGAAEIAPETRVVVAEGTYLCLDEAPWSGLAPLWDYSVFLEVGLEELERRLIARGIAQGLDPEAARARAQANDMPNARRVLAARGSVSQVIAG